MIDSITSAILSLIASRDPSVVYAKDYINSSDASVVTDMAKIAAFVGSAEFVTFDRLLEMDRTVSVVSLPHSPAKPLLDRVRSGKDPRDIVLSFV